MASISELGELKPIEQLDLTDDVYVDQKEYTSIPKAGRFTVRAPESFPAAAFSRTRAGALSAQVDPQIVGPTNEGFTIRFAKVSAKPFKRNGVTVSQMGDYLRANGVKGKMTSEQDLVDAVSQTANSIYEVEVDWRAYNKTSGFSLEGMERFPSDGNGGHQPWTTDPVEKDPETGEPMRLRANLVITRYIAPSVN